MNMQELVAAKAALLNLKCAVLQYQETGAEPKGFSRYDGICGNLPPDRKVALHVQLLYKTWPRYSGHPAFPVPAEDTPRDARFKDRLEEKVRLEHYMGNLGTLATFKEYFFPSADLKAEVAFRASVDKWQATGYGDARFDLLDFLIDKTDEAINELADSLHNVGEAHV